MYIVTCTKKSVDWERKGIIRDRVVILLLGKG